MGAIITAVEDEVGNRVGAAAASETVPAAVNAVADPLPTLPTRAGGNATTPAAAVFVAAAPSFPHAS